jgi:hypothetical protein
MPADPMPADPVPADPVPTDALPAGPAPSTLAAAGQPTGQSTGQSTDRPAPPAARAPVRRRMAQAGEAIVLDAAFVAAPPRVSVRPTRPASHGDGPERTPADVPTASPAVMRALQPSVRGSNPARHVEATPGRSRSELYAATAALFRTFAAPPAAPGSATGTALGAPLGGEHMSSESPVVRRSVETHTAVQPYEPPDAVPNLPGVPYADAPGARLDELVDLVVERIEQRVIDELERRGRRGLPGAF